MSGSVRATGCGVGGEGGASDPHGPMPDPLIRFMLSCLELRTLARLLLVLLARLTESSMTVVALAGPPEQEVEKIGATPSLAPARTRRSSKGDQNGRCWQSRRSSISSVLSALVVAVVGDATPRMLPPPTVGGVALVGNRSSPLPVWPPGLAVAVRLEVDRGVELLLPMLGWRFCAAYPQLFDFGLVARTQTVLVVLVLLRVELVGHLLLPVGGVQVVHLLRVLRFQHLQVLLELLHVLLLAAHLIEQVVALLLQLGVLVGRLAAAVRQLVAPVLERARLPALLVVAVEQVLDLLVLLIAGRLDARQPHRKVVQFLLLLLQQVALVVQLLQQLGPLGVDHLDALLLLVDLALQGGELLLVLLSDRGQLALVLLRHLVQPILELGALFAARLKLLGGGDERIDSLLNLDAARVDASQAVDVDRVRHCSAVLWPKRGLQRHHRAFQLVQYRRHLLHLGLVERVLAGEVLEHEVEICLGEDVVRVRHLQVGGKVGVQVLVLLECRHAEHPLGGFFGTLLELLLARHVVALEHLDARIDQCLVRDDVRELCQQLASLAWLALLLQVQPPLAAFHLLERFLHSVSWPTAASISRRSASWTASANVSNVMRSCVDSA
uniref:Uncharacterized protein n=1 Tax=Anopheles atroparvus TaxID=41427 RepID=A0A182IQA0_ANOAO